MEWGGRYVEGREWCRVMEGRRGWGVVESDGREREEWWRVMEEGRGRSDGQ